MPLIFVLLSTLPGEDGWHSLQAGRAFDLRLLGCCGWVIGWLILAS
jgi:hypothetical protein